MIIKNSKNDLDYKESIIDELKPCFMVGLALLLLVAVLLFL